MKFYTVTILLEEITDPETLHSECQELESVVRFSTEGLEEALKVFDKVN
jgi:hypothetical protein